MVNDKTQNGELSQLFNNFLSSDAVGEQFLQTNVVENLLKSDPEIHIDVFNINLTICGDIF